MDSGVDIIARGPTNKYCYPKNMALRKVQLVETSRPFGYRSPFPNEEHVLLICVVDESVSDSERDQLSAEIIAAKCRYAVCWGHRCSDWDTSIDCAYIETAEDFNPPDETFVMTTWHDDESIEDTIEFWWMNTWFEDYMPTNFGILIIGSSPDLSLKIQRITSDLEIHWNKTQTQKKKDNKAEMATPRKPSD